MNLLLYIFKYAFKYNKYILKNLEIYSKIFILFLYKLSQVIFGQKALPLYPSIYKINPIQNLKINFWEIKFNIIKKYLKSNSKNFLKQE